MWNKAFWKATAERAVRSIVVVLAGATTVAGEWPSWENVGQAALAGVVASLAMSFGGNALGGADNPGPSLIGAEVTSPPAVTPADLGRNEAGAGEGRFVLLCALGVLLALFLFFVVFPALGDDDNHDGRHGNDWELAPIGARA